MRLRALTWNINGLDEKRIGPRMEKLCLEIMVGGDLHAAIAGRPTPPVPDVIVFQEMTRRAFTGQIAPHLRAGGFVFAPSEPPRDRDEYDLVAARRPWVLREVERRPFADSPLARSASIASLDGPHGFVRLVTAHMESLHSGIESRLAQAAEIDAWLHETPTPSVFAGDTNLRRSEWATIRKAGFRALDAFEVFGSPRRAAATWWPEGRDVGFRFDRVWLGPGWTVDALQTRRAGNASDHAGVEVVLSR